MCARQTLHPSPVSSAMCPFLLYILQRRNPIILIIISLKIVLFLPGCSQDFPFILFFWNVIVLCFDLYFWIFLICGWFCLLWVSVCQICTFLGTVFWIRNSASLSSLLWSADSVIVGFCWCSYTPIGFSGCPCPSFAFSLFVHLSNFFCPVFRFGVDFLPLSSVLFCFFLSFCYWVYQLSL